MMLVSSMGPARRQRWHALAAALLISGGALLSGCAASTIADNLPTAAGGLPEEAPKRQAMPVAYPAVHDRPPGRSDTIMTVNDQKRLEDDLVAARARVNANPASGTVPNP